MEGMLYAYMQGSTELVAKFHIVCHYFPLELYPSAKLLMGVESLKWDWVVSCVCVTFIG